MGEPDFEPASAPHVDYIERNRAAWEAWAPAHASTAVEAWHDVLRWGNWGIAESELRLLGGLPAGAEVIELGCGTASISSWLARLGLRPIGVDFVRAQLEVAARMQSEFGTSFGLLCANAEELHFEDDRFDLAISEYGASLWCDPGRWLPEAHRLLRPDGRLIFITNSPLLVACTRGDGGPAGESLVRDHFGVRRVEFQDNGAIEFHSSHAEWIQMLDDVGFALQALMEVRPHADTRARFDLATVEWARRWPSEDVWIAQKKPS